MADQERIRLIMFSIFSLLFWLFCFYLNRESFIIPKIGGGCFGKSKQPSPPQTILPPAPKLPTAEELISAATNTAKGQFPIAYGAREKALSDIQGGALNITPDFYRQFESVTPEVLTPSYFNQFLPTSFEQAMAQQEFANIFPDIERDIKHNLSIAGVATSPILARELAKARGNVAVPIAKYLTELGQKRAEQGLMRYSDLLRLGQERAGTALNARIAGLNAQIGIDPLQDLIMPQTTLGARQSSAQAELDWERALKQADYDNQRAMIEFQQAVNAPKTGGSKGALIGAGLALAAAPFTGGASLTYLPMAMSAGGSIGSLIGGGSSPIDFGTALQLQQLPSALRTQNKQNQVYDMMLDNYMRDNATATPVNMSPAYSPVIRPTISFNDAIASGLVDQGLYGG